MLKFRVESLDEVEEQYRGLYKETKQGDKTVFVLQVEGAVPGERLNDLQKKLNDFRRNNGRLSERLKVFCDQAGIEVTEDVTPEDLADLLKEKRAELEQSLKGQGHKSKEEIEAEVVRRVEQFKQTHETKLTKLNENLTNTAKERDTLRTELERKAIGQEIMEAGAEIGLKPKATQMIIDQALKVFRRKEGKTRALDAEGDAIPGSDGVNEMTVSDWLQNRAMKDFDFAFETNSGGGASGGSGGAGRNGSNRVHVNPWKEGDTFNRTEQMKLKKSDPQLAARLAAEAGRK